MILREKGLSGKQHPQGGISDHGAEDFAVVDAVALLEPTSNQSGTEPLNYVVGIAFTFENPLCRQGIPDGVDVDQLPCTIPSEASYLFVHGFTPYVSITGAHRLRIELRFIEGSIVGLLEVRLLVQIGSSVVWQRCGY
jgi:hypothetical protein